jgi:hypothetical protein
VADFTQTISNALTVFAGKVTQKWGATDNMVWGTSMWGYKGDFSEIQVEKQITNSLTLADPAFVFSVEHLISESLSIADAQTVSFEKLITESLTTTGDSSSQTLQDASGYFYVFTRPTTNNENTVNTSYSSQSAGTTSFTSLSNTSTSWS